MLFETLAQSMMERGYGVLVGISSVAGDRGRASNYWYGSAKSGFTEFLSGLRQRMQSSGVKVLTCQTRFCQNRDDRKFEPASCIDPQLLKKRLQTFFVRFQKTSLCFTLFFGFGSCSS